MSLSTALTKFFTTYTALLGRTAPLRLLVGVSGGPDSLALLHALTQLQTFDLEIHVAHLNHCLRGDQSRADAQFVAGFARTFPLPYYQAEFEVAHYARTYKLSLEAAARAVRYAFFAHLMSAHQISLLLIAHQADDQAETVLLHLLRGSGPHGLTGIPVLAAFPLPTTPPAFEYDSDFMRETKVGRPLLDLWRLEIEAYCTTHDLQPRFDHSNADTTYQRNRVRLELLPLIQREYKTGFKQNLVRLASILQTDEQFLDAQTTQIFTQMATVQDFTIAFELAAFRATHPALQARLLRYAYQKLNGSLENLEAVHLDLTQQAVYTDTPAWTLELPGGIVAHKTARRLIISCPSKILASLPQLPPDVDSLPLTVNNRVNLPLAHGWNLEARVFDKTEISDLQNVDRFVARLDYVKVGAALKLRPRQPGDKVQPLGAPGHRKLQDVLLDAKIPKAARPRWPIVVKTTPPEQIVWVAGGCIAEPFKVTQQSQEVLELKLCHFLGS